MDAGGGRRIRGGIRVREELELKSVIFTFSDDSQKILRGEELDEWVSICYGHSDYILPGNSSHILAEMFGGVVRGFVPFEVVERRET